METLRPSIAGHGLAGTAGLFRSNNLAAFDLSECRAALVAQVATCISRAFEAIGAGSQTQEIVFWKLYVARNIGRNEIVDKPAEFIEGIRDIYGDAGAVVFEYKLAKEMRREFGIAHSFENDPAKRRDFAQLVRQAAFAALG